MFRATTFLMVVGLAGCGSPSPAISKDAIVSTTLCADTYLMAIPELEPHLAALSWQSRSSLSRAPKSLQSLPQIDDDAERLHRWQDATIVSSAGTKGDINLSWGEDFTTVWTNFSILSKSLNVTDPTPHLKAKLEKLPHPSKDLRLLYLDRSGATAGTGTFVDAVFQAAGATNIIQTPGWQSPDTETLLTLHPDVIVTSFMGSNYVGVNDRSVRHAGLARKIDALPRIDLHGGLWPCAGPGLIEATVQLSSELAKL
ncbi:hypothetical protein GCM10011309_22890 [Litorimonas cladophorae]|uniref:Iron complex transport system substrate-binding protein n=1 Tax=Litorimonas cladophorae TaxID=1220491 RepID=A0A918KSU1_9PROT|nr:hypothetical protein [Litorimonas cladophorae]GGX72050.1 hypothetical protein GCM10011309_22890 [Litorimonas cladophorae]